MAAKSARSVFIVGPEGEFSRDLELGLTENINNPLTFEHYTSGEACINQLNKKPDIILMALHFDKNPKSKNGLDYLRKIKRKGNRAEVVIISYEDNVDLAVDVMSSGAFYYVVQNEGAIMKMTLVMSKLLKYIKALEDKRFQKRMTNGLIALAVVAIAAIILTQLVFPELLSI